MFNIPFFENVVLKAVDDFKFKETMIVKCLYNTGEYLRKYEYKLLGKDIFGRFGTSASSEYGEINIGAEYFVMGIVVFETYQAYLIDGNGLISVCPCQLFEVLDNSVSKEWHFRLIDKDESIYPFVQTIIGYPELCSDKSSYEKLIVEMEEKAYKTYFERKVELYG